MLKVPPIREKLYGLQVRLSAGAHEAASAAKSIALHSAARAGNALYALNSFASIGSLRKLQQLHPEAFVVPPERIEGQAMNRIPNALQRVIFHITGVDVPIEKVRQFVGEAFKHGLFVNFGEVAYIDHRRLKNFIDDLSNLDELRGVSIDEKLFREEATERALLHGHLFANQVAGGLQADYPLIDGREYRVRPYLVDTRDARPLKLTGIIQSHAVSANDDSPSVLCLNGIFCTKGSMSDLVLNLASQNMWAYGFDVRGTGDNTDPERDQNVFFDSHVSNDLPAVLDFIANRPKGKMKPVILVGHSMGGMIAEFMVVRQAYKLNCKLEEIGKKTHTNPVLTNDHSRKEVEEYLLSEQITDRAENDRELGALVSEAMEYLAKLNSVKGIITLGSPKIFDKNAHPIWPALLHLNIIIPRLLPFFRQNKIPVSLFKWLVSHFPKLANALRLLINSKNFDDPEKFLADFVLQGTDDAPLGVGLQFEKDIFSGKGFRRMGKTKFNYAEHLHMIPTDIPIFHVIGRQDVLCPTFNLGFIDRRYAQGHNLDFSHFSRYSHATQGVTEIAPDTDVNTLAIDPIKSQVQGFVVETGHLDFLFGNTANRQVIPLIHRLIEAMKESK